jgi:hypothetical protein
MWKKRQLTHPKSIDPFSSFSSLRGCLHLRFCVRIDIRFRVRFPAQSGLQLNFQPIFPYMCWQAVVVGAQKITKTLNPSLYANHARIRSAIRTQNRTRVDGP